MPVYVLLYQIDCIQLKFSYVKTSTNLLFVSNQVTQYFFAMSINLTQKVNLCKIFPLEIVKTPKK